jgi:hypothetical protein
LEFRWSQLTPEWKKAFLKPHCKAVQDYLYH